MDKTQKKRIKRKLINFQNQLGKMVGRIAWSNWKKDNNIQSK